MAGADWMDIRLSFLAEPRNDREGGKVSNEGVGAGGCERMYNDFGRRD